MRMKRLLFSFVMMLTATMAAWADVVEVNGLRYNVSTGTVPLTASVIAPAEGVYTGEITIPSSINYNGEDITVDFIRSDAFKNATITKVTIPSTVYFIGGQAFYHCENLTEITLPEGLQEISSSAFSGCPFTTLTIPGTVTKIDSYGLEGLSSLQKLTFAYSAEKLSMSGNEFNSTNNIEELVIDRDYRYGNNQSLGQNSVKKVTIGEHITRIPENACYRMSLEELTIGANVTTIGNSAFMLCTFPEGYTFPFAQIKEIEDGGFYLCKKLPANLDLSSVEKLGGNAFRSCDYLTSITLGDNLTEIGGEAFYECKGLTTITIPASVMTIGDQAFYGCDNLTNIDIPYSTQQLEMFDCPFGYCPADIRIDRPFKVTKKQSSYNPTVSRGAKGVIIGPNVSSVPEYAFWDNSKLEKVTFESSSNSISINSSAFTDSPFTELVFDRTITYSSNSEPMSTALTKVTVGPNIANYLGYLNLKKCPDLAEVVFMDGCKKVPNEAFRNMTKLSTVTLPKGLETIESYAFNGCTALAAITLPEGLKTISQQAFTGTAITSVTVPGTARSISSAFKGCEQLTSLTLAYSDNLTDDGWMYGKGVLTSDGSAFDGSPITDVAIDRAWKPNVWDYKAPIQTAKRVTFGPNATNIPDCMFKGLTTVESIAIGENVSEVGSRAFQNCTLPEGTTIPFAQFKKIGDYAFEVCAGVPATLNLDVIEEIGSYAFQNCTSIENLTIGGGTIGSNAFHGCTNLSSITLNEGVTEIGGSNFSNLTNLATISLPSTLKKIGSEAFRADENLTIPGGLPNGLEVIDTRAFYDCKKLNVSIPGTVTNLGQSAFSGCESLTEVTIPAGVTSLGMYTFNGCIGLTSITIPGTLNSMSSQEFASCTNLTEVRIEYGENPISISQSCFYNSPCTNVYIDRAYTWSTGGNATYFKNTENIEFGSHVTAIPARALYQSNKLTNITMTDNVTSIGERAFYGAKVIGLKLSKNIESVGQEAFYNASFNNSFTFPISVNAIGNVAFYSSSLKDVYVPWLTPLGLDDDSSSWTVGRFSYGSDQTLWVPGGTMDAYQDATVWKKFQKFDYWSFVVNATVAGKGQLDVANGEAVHANGTNTAKSVTGTQLVEAGAGTPVSGLFVREKDVTFTATPARGYELSTLTANGTDVKAASKVANLLADQNIAAEFTPIIYTITYNNLQNGVLPTGYPETYTVETETFTLPHPERTAYNFLGWTGTDLEGTVLDVTIEKDNIGNREYTAVWEPIVYDITYDLAGGAVDPANLDKYTIETADFTLTNPTKLGYTFTGWEGTDLTEKTMAVTVTTGHWGDRSYTATWEPNPYKVRFDINGGDGTETMADQDHVYDAPLNLTQNAFTRTGYTFKEWNSKADGTGTVYADKAEVVNFTAVRDEVVTIYAQWTPNPYKVRFNANNGTGTMANQDFVYDTQQALTENAFTRTGYTFKQWTANADGTGASYADKASVKNLTAELNGVVDIYAQWQVIVYDITYDLAGGTVATANPTEYNIENASFTLNNPTREGYIFAGWTGTDLSTVTENVTIVTGSYGNRTYIATWTPIVYDITYDLAGGTVATANLMNYTIETPTFSLNNPTKAHWIFKGWTGTDLGTATTTVTIATGNIGDRSYTATWERETYTVSITSNLANMVTASTTSPKYEDDVVLTIADNDDYDLVSLTVDGVDVTSQISGGKYTISSVSANVAVVATYNANKAFITMAHAQQTFSCTQPLDFTGVTGLKAYIASGYIDGTVVLTRVDKVPASTGLFLVGTEGAEYKVPFAASSAFYSNLLKPVLTAQTVPSEADGYTNFLYSEVNGVKGFYKSSASGTVAAGKAYLQLPTSALSNGVKAIGFTFEGEETAIEAVESSRWQERTAVYDLAGRKVADTFEPKKLPQGVYIVNGKKVAIK